jgi:hypothetical protein
MTVCVCIASRGRPEALTTAVTETFNRSHHGCKFHIAIDDDDESDYVYGTRGPRENSLGAKYNRAASYAAGSNASLYVLGVDDCYLATPGWDDALLQAAAKFEDGVGCVYFGPKKDLFDLPEGIAVTKGWIDQVGFFMPPHFPFWWHDTWVDEIARMTGRYVWANVQWEKFGSTEKPGGHKTTRMREVSWWAKFFDSTRQIRVNKALEMITGLDYPEWYRTQLRQEMQGLANVLWRRNGLVRDRGHEFEQTYGGETAPDAGYVQIRAEAEQMLAGLK